MKLGNVQNNAETTTTKKTFDPVPKARYGAEIAFIKISPTKDGTGEKCEATFKITDGEHAGRYIWHTFNLINKSAKAQEVAESQMDKYLKCVGYKKGYNKDEFSLKFILDWIKKPVAINVDIEPAKGQYKAKNKISSFAVK